MVDMRVHEQRPGLFAKFLEECCIILLYFMPSSSNMNGVVNRPNETLKDMTRSIICHSTLLCSL